MTVSSPGDDGDTAAGYAKQPGEERHQFLVGGSVHWGRIQANQQSVVSRAGKLRLLRACNDAHFYAHAVAIWLERHVSHGGVETRTKSERWPI